MDRKYDRPRTSIKVSINGIGRRMIVQVGTKWNTGIKAKNTPIVTKAKIPVDVVVTIGKKSRFMLRDCKIPTLLVKLTSPSDVPLTKIW